MGNVEMKPNGTPVIRTSEKDEIPAAIHNLAESYVSCVTDDVTCKWSNCHLLYQDMKYTLQMVFETVAPFCVEKMHGRATPEELEKWKRAYILQREYFSKLLGCPLMELEEKECGSIRFWQGQLGTEYFFVVPLEVTPQNKHVCKTPTAAVLEPKWRRRVRCGAKHNTCWQERMKSIYLK
jgi:hypothetical protein